MLVINTGTPELQKLSHNLKHGIKTLQCSRGSSKTRAPTDYYKQSQHRAPVVGQAQPQRWHCTAKSDRVHTHVWNVFLECNNLLLLMKITFHTSSNVPEKQQSQEMIFHYNCLFGYRQKQRSKQRICKWEAWIQAGIEFILFLQWTVGSSDSVEL